MSPQAMVRRRRSFFRRLQPTALLFALPALIVFGYFSWLPIVRGALMSAQKTNLIDEPTWVGFANFEYVLTDPLLPTAVWNTLWYAIVAVIIGFPVPLFLAVFIAEHRRSRQFYSVLAYLPVVLPPVVSILLWKFFYDPSPDGLFNTVLGWFGIEPFAWLGNSSFAMIGIVIEATWASAGGTVIIYMAALLGVRAELYEAAELDGVGVFGRIWHVTLPQIRGIVLVMLLLQVIGTAQVFAEPYLFTGGGPQNATLTVLLMIFRYAFVSGDFGAATALSMLLALVLGVFSFLYLFATRRWGKN